MNPRNPLEPVPGRPGMYGTPSETPTEGANTLCCFLTPDRVCGPDCMAYNTTPPTSGDYKDQPWPHCHLLLNAHRVGKHMVIVAESLSKMLKGDPAAQQTNIQPPEVR